MLRRYLTTLSKRRDLGRCVSREMAFGCFWIQGRCMAQDSGLCGIKSSVLGDSGIVIEAGPFKDSPLPWSLLRNCLLGFGGVADVRDLCGRRVPAF